MFISGIILLALGNANRGGMGNVMQIEEGWETFAIKVDTGNPL